MSSTAIQNTLFPLFFNLQVGRRRFFFSEHYIFLWVKYQEKAVSAFLGLLNLLVIERHEENNKHSPIFRLLWKFTYGIHLGGWLALSYRKEIHIWGFVEPMHVHRHIHTQLPPLLPLNYLCLEVLRFQVEGFFPI